MNYLKKLIFQRDGKQGEQVFIFVSFSFFLLFSYQQLLQTAVEAVIVAMMIVTNLTIVSVPKILVKPVQAAEKFFTTAQRALSIIILERLVTTLKQPLQICLHFLNGHLKHHQLIQLVYWMHDLKLLLVQGGKTLMQY